MVAVAVRLRARCREITNRGTVIVLINHPKRAKQIISFEGMERRRGIIPTDIDGFIDYKGGVVVYMEAKLVDAPVTVGQRLALENVVKSHEQTENKACAVIFRHDTQAEEVIIAKDQNVDEMYFEYEDEFDWRNPKNENYTLLQFLHWWEGHCEREGYIL